MTLYKHFASKKGIEVGVPENANLPLRFTLRVEGSFEALKEGCLKYGVSIRRGVDELLHRTIGLRDEQFPCATKLFNQTVSIPFYPSLCESEVEKVFQSLDALK